MNDSNVYTAERILAKRKHHGVTQYYIKWKGYSIKESTWEPAENILDRSLLTAFENTTKNKSTSSHSSSHASTSRNRDSENRNSRFRQRYESRSSSSSSSSATTSSLKRTRGRPRKKSYIEQRQEQVRLQRQIELQQQKTHLVHQNFNNDETNNGTSSSNLNTKNDNNTASQKPDKKRLVIFNPVEAPADVEVVEEDIYEPELSKNPVLVTDVTSDEITVTISECRTPEGFFRT